jgi:hypothetical protein
MTQQLALQLDDAPAPRPGRPRSHHVRSHQTVEEAAMGEERAQRQEAAVLNLMRAFRNVAQATRAAPGRWTPSEVAAMFPAWPITSIRRALTNLSTARPGQPDPPLVHYPADRRPGPHGAKESTWGLA